LQFAIGAGKVKMVLLLLRMGANMSLKDATGRDAVGIAKATSYHFDSYRERNPQKLIHILLDYSVHSHFQNFPELLNRESEVRFLFK